MNDSRNMILAVILSVAVLFGWQFFVAQPQLERAQRQAEIAAEQAQGSTLPAPSTEAAPAGAAAPAAPGGQMVFADRAAALAAGPRVKIETASLLGSINLTGGRLDDLHLKNYTETVDPTSPIITLLSPAGAPNAYFAEQGWVAPGGVAANVPGPDTLWRNEGNDTLTEANPVTIVWDNGEGLTFSRTFAVDANYLFTVTQSVSNASGAPVTLYPFARVSRHDTPVVQNFFVMHEGPIGVLGERGLVSTKYGDIQNDQRIDVTANGGWLGFADKYWATTVLSEPGKPINARFSYAKPGATDIYQASFVGTEAQTAAPGASVSHTSYVFAGAKKEGVIASYEQEKGFDRLELLIDWGWFHFITKPLFHLLTFLYGILGNFGLAILAVTVLVKLLFFPLANRSYASMAAMRRVQPEMKALQERFKDDRAAQQQAMMELYKKEKINPLSGCWPILIQIPVFFSLYTVLFISLEMRHAPFFGWVQDLAAPDPTNIFTLFGLIPWTPTALPIIGSFLHLGIWPIIMGLTMWVQMKLNPPPTDPSQAMIFGLMPIIFTFMLGGFPAGLVIYWAWNNFLSVLQQWIIMKRHGVEVDLFGNILTGLGLKKKPAGE